MTLSELLKKENILIDIKAKTKEDVLGALVAKVVNGFDHDAVLTALREREDLGSTGIGYGVAVPHIRVDSVQDPVVVFGRVRDPIEFAAVDEQPCSLFFLVIGPTQRDAQERYLKLMAKISRIVRNASVRDALMKATSNEEVIRIFEEQDH